ncbi:hypothetical protein [Moraxella lacunata]|uniref:hypothetical protein n=1 Tax=Moraxella lacunata TaxID=477 RepID=UPI003EE0996E
MAPHRAIKASTTARVSHFRGDFLEDFLFGMATLDEKSYAYCSKLPQKFLRLL